MTTITAQPRLSPAETPRARRITGQTRVRIALIGAAAVLLALITLVQAFNAYRISYDLFRGIAEVNSTTVDSAERALQYLAQASQSAADYALLTSDTPLYEEAQNNIFRAFSLFRDELFILRGNLQSGDEQTAYTTAETYTYSRFWRHVSNLVANRSNDALARREYLDADNHVRNWITPALQTLERLNFDGMVEAGANAGSIISGQVILFAVPALALALLLTYLSFVVRAKVRRYITPGLDVALIAAWVLLILVALNLADAPNQINVMIDDAYLSVSASARTLVDANAANRAESSLLLDSDNALTWDTRYAQAAEAVSLRLCGSRGCTMQSFINASGALSPGVVTAANLISDADSARIDGIAPLVANVTFAGEAEALERARRAFEEFREAHVEVRSSVSAGDFEKAVLVNTSPDDPGSSQETFNRFVAAIEEVQSINRAVFDQTWESQRAILSRNQVMYGIIGYALVIGLIAFGVWQRTREL